MANRQPDWKYFTIGNCSNLQKKIKHLRSVNLAIKELKGWLTLKAKERNVKYNLHWDVASPCRKYNCIKLTSLKLSLHTDCEVERYRSSKYDPAEAFI